ncbi:Cerato-platanin [Sparassis latifolia]
MLFANVFPVISLLLVPTVIGQTAVSVTYDTTYDLGTNSLNIVACSNGVNGLESKGYTTFGSLPNFPNIGGSFAVTGWNSTGCGTCWNVTYDDTTVTVVAIDTAEDGFNLSEEAMNTLTDNQAVALGSVTATAVQVDASLCGLP